MVQPVQPDGSPREALPKKDFPPGFGQEQVQRKSEAARELFQISEEDLPVKTETPGRLVYPFAMMATAEDAIDVNRRQRLSYRFRMHHDRRMISKNRKSRGEIIQITQTQKSDDDMDFFKM